MIEVFVSRPNWVPSLFQNRLHSFYSLLPEFGFNPNTIGQNHVPLKTPFEEVSAVMRKCQCTIVLGLPQIFVEKGHIKQVALEAPFKLPTEWNQIETTMSLMLNLPTLVLLHKGVSSRGIFERGASNSFVHEFDVSKHDWVNGIRPALQALRSAIA